MSVLRLSLSRTASSFFRGTIGFADAKSATTRFASRCSSNHAKTLSIDTDVLQPPGVVVKKSFHMYPDGSIYDGDLLGTKKHGHGKLTLPDCTVITGEWSHDELVASTSTPQTITPSKAPVLGKVIYKATGEVETRTRRNGTVETGIFVNNLLHGHGEQETSFGNKYSGEFKYGKKHGHGKQTNLNGTVYEGQFENDMWSGTGKVVYASGAVYVGQFADNVYNGTGRLLHKNKVTKEGAFVDGEFVAGKYTIPPTVVLEGSFVNDRLHGYGKLTHLNDYTYEGEFKHGLKHGHGTKTYKNGSVYVGGFVDNQCCGSDSVHTSPNGMVYRGSFRNNTRLAGVLSLPNGSYLSGTFHQNRLHGQGMYRSGGGVMHTGEFVNGVLHGNGVVVNSAGVVFKGRFEEGALVEGTVDGKLFERKDKMNGTWGKKKDDAGTTTGVSVGAGGGEGGDSSSTKSKTANEITPAEHTIPTAPTTTTTSTTKTVTKRIEAGSTLDVSWNTTIYSRTDPHATMNAYDTSSPRNRDEEDGVVRDTVPVLGDSNGVSVASIVVTSDTSTTTSSISAEPVKRGRGRPRKVVAPSATDA